jgi:hypothetical protein
MLLICKSLEPPMSQLGQKAERLAVSIFNLDYPQEQTSSRHSGISEKCHSRLPKHPWTRGHGRAGEI